MQIRIRSARVVGGYPPCAQSVSACGGAVLTEDSVGPATRLVVHGPVTEHSVEAVAARVQEALGEGFTDVLLRWIT